MPVAEARATEPALQAYEADREKDVRALRKLAAWADRFSPIVGLEDSPALECLLLDITGGADCFHGEDRLARRTLRALRAQGFTARATIADTVGAAWALAHHHSPLTTHHSQGPVADAPGSDSPSPLYSGERGWGEGDFCVVPPGEIAQTVRSLPLTALRLPEEVLHTLAELGLERIEQLLEWPRDSLPGRFGPVVLERLDQILGRLPEPIVRCRFRPEPQARCSFEYPTDSRSVLRHALEYLLDRVVKILRERQRGAKHLECWLYREAAAPLSLEVRLFRPSRSPAHLGKLLQARLEQTRLGDLDPDDPGELVSGICLRVPVVEKIPEHQESLFQVETSREELATLIDRLVSRCGRETVTFASLVADAQPELAYRFAPAISEKRSWGLFPRLRQQARKQTPEEMTPDSSFAHGPVQVWPIPDPIETLSLVSRGTPSQFRRAGKEYTVTRSWGPERIETGWWRGLDIRRDYYIVETGEGTRWWIFRRREDGRWFLHGCFD
jgi:protein ImuB